jgi:peptidoglycan hydrolase-like protein with peptidoglycan-binding domain
MLLVVGSRGENVRQLQIKLNRCGLGPPPLKTDGVFGPLTKAKLIEFQKRYRLKPDGMFGEMSAVKLAFVVPPENAQALISQARTAFRGVYSSHDL